jgi:CyaY protein
MTQSEFENMAEATLERIAQALDGSGAECDCEPKGAGVLELEFADASRIIVNRHSAAQEIWVAAKSGGYHFRWNGSNWIETRDGDELFATLSKVVSGQAGQAVTLKSN